MKITVDISPNDGNDESITYVESQNTNVTPPDTLRIDLLNELQYFEEKAVRFAKEMPDDHYSWRPNENAASVSELFMYIAYRNFQTNILKFASPAELKEESFVVSEHNKIKIIEILRESFFHFRKCLLSFSDTRLNKTINPVMFDCTFRVLTIKKFRGLATVLGRISVYRQLILPLDGEQKSKQKHSRFLLP